jgi:UDP-N-acetylmuramyl pentapeptide phosphotransferase/UDP-N-acetylglucosamine-1-phosphate transferase
MSMTLLTWELAVGLAAWAVASWIVGWTSAWAARHELFDVPIYRSSHTSPKPRLGGIGIALTVSVGCLLAFVVALPEAPILAAIAGVAIVVAGVSLIDDLHGLPALPRLAVHTFAAVATVLVLGWVTEVRGVAGVTLHLGVFGLVLSLVWIVGFINAFNFMDGLDGIAGTQATLAGFAWAAIGWKTGEPALAWAGILLAGASLGFLRHNWQPSSIFLGDVGATYLGYWVAAMPFLSINPSAMALPAVLIAWPFVFDVLFTIIDRVRRREHLLAGHKEHFYQRLAATGWSHAQVSLFYAALSTLGALAALAVVSGDGLTSTMAVAAVVASAIGLYRLVQRRERLVPAPARVRAAEVAEVLTDAPQPEP